MVVCNLSPPGSFKTVKNYLWTLLDFVKFLGLKTYIKSTSKAKDLVEVWRNNLNAGVRVENAVLRERQQGM